jgi:DNA polymerase, archaea type
MLDIFKDLKPLDDIVPFTDFKTLPDLSTVPALGVDIETGGLNSDRDPIYMIGLNLNGKRKIIYYENDGNPNNEEFLLKRFMVFIGNLHAKTQFYLYGHNIFQFDLPYIIKRCAHYKIPTFSYRTIKGEKFTRSFLLGGSYPLIYSDIKAPGIDIIDTYMLTRLNDAKYLFSDQTLKTVALAIGARKERRLEIGSQVKEFWTKGDYETLKQYLTYDLEDAQSILYKFLPPYYYMQTFLPMTMQEIILSGSAGKIESMMRKHYPNSWFQPQDKSPYVGAYTACDPGFYRDVNKFDVSSQYPFIMLNYRLGPGDKKDPDGYFFSILKTLREKRLEYKALSKKGDEAAGSISEAMKIVINSMYGLLGSERSYNNFNSAADVCAYGQLIVKLMIKSIEKRGGRVVEVDTDGILFVDMSPDLLPEILTEMPSGLEIEHEFKARWVYLDAAKNYLISLSPNNILKKGLFRKRNSMPFFTEFHINYCEKMYQSQELAEQYRKQTDDLLIARKLDIKKITVCRTISKSEKYCLQYGKPGEKISVYYGYGKNGKAAPTIDGPYHFEYYAKKIADWVAKINGREAPEKPEEFLGTDTGTLEALKTINKRKNHVSCHRV